MCSCGVQLWAGRGGRRGSGSVPHPLGRRPEERAVAILVLGYLGSHWARGRRSHVAQRKGGADSLCVRVWSCVVGDVCGPCSSGSVCLRVCVSVCEGLRGWAGGSDRVSICQTLRMSACVSGLLTLAPADFALNASEFCFRKVLVASGPHPLGHRLPLRPRQGPLQSQWCSLPRGWDGPEPGPLPAFPRGPQRPGGMCARDGGQNGRVPLPASGFRLRLGPGSQVNL